MRPMLPPYRHAPNERLMGLGFLLGVVTVLLALNVVSFAFAKIGVSSRVIVPLFFASLLGSLVNIPIARLRGERIAHPRVVVVFGVRYLIPALEREPTILAVNVGGAVIPTALSAYLVVHDGRLLTMAIATAVVAIVVHRIARLVPGLGVAVPALAPPLLAAAVAVALAGHGAAPVAYVSGTLGSLIGADLANIPRIARLGAPVASIGGGGTFDGVFLAGIVAVVLVAVL
jgi:uncharacterized membrane protein